MSGKRKSAVQRTALRFGVVFLLTAALLLPYLALDACRHLPEGGSAEVAGLTVTRLGFSRWQITAFGRSVILNASLPEPVTSLLRDAAAVFRLLLPAAARRFTLPGT